MSSNYRAHEETAITKEEHDRLMRGRTRPLTQLPMSNDRASVVRMESLRATASPVDTVLERIDRFRANHPTANVHGRTAAVEQELTEASVTDGCGTDDGYRRHIRNGEKPCDDCKLAHRRHNAEIRETRRAS